MKNEFIKRPDYRPLDDGVNYVLVGRMKYLDLKGRLIVVPAGFETDFASIPNLSQVGFLFFVAFCTMAQFWQPVLFGSLAVFPAWVVWISEDFLHEGTWDDQSALHDYLYRTRCRGFWQSNWILFRAMKAKGGAVTPFWKRCLIFGGVTVGGWTAWTNDHRRQQPLCNPQH